MPKSLHFLIPICLDLCIAFFLYRIAQYAKPLLDAQKWDKTSLPSEVVEEVDKEVAVLLTNEEMQTGKGLRKRKGPETETNVATTSSDDKKEIDLTIPPRDTINPSLVALLYLVSPLTIMSCLSCNTSIWTFTSLIAALSYACQGKNIFKLTK